MVGLSPVPAASATMMEHLVLGADAGVDASATSAVWKRILEWTCWRLEEF